MKFSTLITFFLGYSVSLGICQSDEINEENESVLDFDEFLKLNSSKITYLIFNNESEIQTCEHVKKIYGLFESGQLIEQKEVTQDYVLMDHYIKNGSDTQKLKFYNDFECLNFLVHDEEKKIGLKVPIRKYLLNSSKVISESIGDVKSSKTEDVEILCNNGSESAIIQTKEKEYYERYESEMDFTEANLIDFGNDVSIPFMPDDFMSYTEDDYVVQEEKNSFKYSRLCTRPSQDVSVPAGKGMLLSGRVLKVEMLKRYTVDLEIEDNFPEEDSRRFKTFRQKLRSGEVALHQSRNGVYFDFSSEDSVVLRNFPVHEYVTQFTKMYTLSDPECCDKLMKMKKILTYHNKKSQ